jgi:hypothetical protein
MVVFKISNKYLQHTGAIVYTTTIANILQQEFKLDVSQLAAGGYFISIENEQTKSVGSFIKVKE